MEVTATDIARIPAGNVRIPREEFVMLWAAAERRNEEQVRRRVADWYTYGVVATCRWVATATVRSPVEPWHPARSPVTERTARAYEELIEAELLAAEKLAMRRPAPAWLAGRPGWLDAIVATLSWSWRRSGRPPIDPVDAALG